MIIMNYLMGYYNKLPPVARDNFFSRKYTDSTVHCFTVLLLLFTLHVMVLFILILISSAKYSSNMPLAILSAAALITI